jgi:type IV pilus assembly protein PilF
MAALLGFCILLAVPFVSGCGSAPRDRTSTTDLVTDSDEPDARKRARIRLELATGYYRNGQTSIALDEIKQAISADPNFFDSYNLRGLIYMRLNNVPLAEDSFRRALSINPKAARVQHNYGLLLCQQSRMQEALQLFGAALADPSYDERSKTWMIQGGCQLNSGLRGDAEISFLRSYELDPANPITGYNLALLLFQRGEFLRSQFYTRRLNNSESANAESLWLGIRVERKLGHRDAVEQLSAQLKKRFPQSREFSAFERSAFDE